MIPRRLLGCLSCLSLFGLSACAPTLNTQQIADTIQQSIIKQGGISLKGVICPDRIKPATGQSFECFGELDTGKAVAIAVKQVDSQGTVTWDVPSVRGLLNLTKLETELQNAIKAETGVQPKVQCGSPFRSAKPGESFECKVLAQVAKKAGQKAATPVAQPSAKAGAKKKEPPDTILVSINSEGNVDWQQVFKAPVPIAKANDAESEKAANTEAEADPAKATKPASPAPPAQASADDFLNQPGATDSFD
jgi:hypothetical protein